MSTHRTWDESRSPQWRYLQEKESMVRKGNRKTAARLRREEIEKNLSASSIRKEEQFDKINSELKKEKVKYDIKRTTRLSTKPEEQE